jgi:hypothetical protein
MYTNKLDCWWWWWWCFKKKTFLCDLWLWRVFEILKIYAIRKSVDLSQDEELNILNTELDGCRTLRFLFFGAQMCELLSQQNSTVSSVSTDHQVNYASSPVEDLIYFPSNAVPARAPLIEVVGFSVQNLGMCPVLFDALLFLSICV